MNNHSRVVAWFSGGVTSAIAAKITINKYKGNLPVVVAFCDTGSEHSDNYRFLDDIAIWLDWPITILKNENYKNTHDVYLKDRYLVGVRGARCSLVLKKEVRRKFENLKTDIQIFGFHAGEKNRAERFLKNNSLGTFEFPLIEHGLSSDDCHAEILAAGIKRPVTYDYGFNNANCLDEEHGGCVKGGMGYWNLYRKFA